MAPDGRRQADRTEDQADEDPDGGHRQRLLQHQVGAAFLLPGAAVARRPACRGGHRGCGAKRRQLARSGRRDRRGRRFLRLPRPLGRRGAAVGHHRRRSQGSFLPLRIRQGAPRGVDASAETPEGKRTPPALSAVVPPDQRRGRRATGRLLAAIALAGFVVLVIVSITGGFTIRAGPLHFSAHGWRTPLVVALAAFGAVGLSGRAALTDAFSAAWPWIDDHAAGCALVLAAAAAGVGVAHGTYSASSSDASGYISEARLIASARIADDEPRAREVAWPNATWAFAPLGYRPGSDAGELVPTYPAGLPLAIAPVRLLGGELAAYLVVPLLAAVAVFATYGAGARLHSRRAGLAAALLLATTPIVLFQAVQPMSDVAVTAWRTLALPFALSPLPNGPLAAGSTAGLAVLTRPNLLPLVAVVALAVMNFPRGCHERRLRRGRLIGFAAGIIPAVGAQLLMQWRLYGGPPASRDRGGRRLFPLRKNPPNPRRDPARGALSRSAPPAPSPACPL